MAIISIFSGAFCRGEEIANRVAAQLGYERIDERLLEVTSTRWDTPEASLEQTLRGERPLLNRFTHEREKNLAHLRLELARLIQDDDRVCHGFASHLLPRAVPHILWVCLIASREYRINLALESTELSKNEAEPFILNEDRARTAWTQFLYSKNPYDSELYDAVLPLHTMTVEEAVDRICHYSLRPALRTTQDSLQKMKDFLLAAKVGEVLAARGHEVSVTARRGHVSISIDKYVVNLERHKRKLERLAKNVAGVKNVETTPGTGFIPPTLTRSLDLELPSKVLLVDDEVEFVQTLSERLQSRNLEASVAYGGEEALSYIETDEPEVMVLDLKMPGIDGIEVLRRVRSDHPEIKVVILTGHGSDKEKQLALDLGAFAYLRKPVDIDTLAQVMKDAYRQAREDRQRRTGEQQD